MDRVTFSFASYAASRSMEDSVDRRTSSMCASIWAFGLTISKTACLTFFLLILYLTAVIMVRVTLSFVLHSVWHMSCATAIDKFVIVENGGQKHDNPGSTYPWYLPKH